MEKTPLLARVQKLLTIYIHNYMKLFLTSSGLSNDNEKEFLDLLGRSPLRLKLAFVITATRGDNPNIPIDGLKKEIERMEDYQGLVRLGFEITFVDFQNIREENVVNDFASFDVIYVFGGNTFYLLKYARQSGFIKHAKEILENKVYVGVSAGSIIAGPDISLAGWEGGDRNDIGLEDMAGMSLAPFCVMPHWQEGRMIPREAAEYPNEIQYIEDNGAVIVT